MGPHCSSSKPVLIPNGCEDKPRCQQGEKGELSACVRFSSLPLPSSPPFPSFFCCSCEISEAVQKLSLAAEPYPYSEPNP